MSYVDLNEGNSYMDTSTSAEYVAQDEQFLLMQDMVCDAPSSMAYSLVDGASSHLFSFIFQIRSSYTLQKEHHSLR